MRAAAPLRRCPWGRAFTDPLSLAYHDREWGRPVHEDRLLFEFLVLEGMQAGLSWQIVLRKRERFRRAFAGFAPEKVARFSSTKVSALLRDPGIIRNRLKIESAVSNAGAFLRLQKEFGSFDAYLWAFVGGRPRQNAWSSVRQLPTRSAESDALSRDLRSRGFRFVGSTICYAYMQAVGMVNDHTRQCFRWAQLGGGQGRR